MRARFLAASLLWVLAASSFPPPPPPAARRRPLPTPARQRRRIGQGLPAPERIRAVRRLHQEDLDDAAPLDPRPAGGGAGPQAPPAAGQPLARLHPARPRTGRGSKRPAGGARQRASWRRSTCARCPTDPPRAAGARPALPAPPLRGPGRTLQRDVRLGQLLHPARPAARRRGRARRATWSTTSSTRSSTTARSSTPTARYYLTPLAAAVPDADDARRVYARTGDRAWLHAARRRRRATTAFWTTEPHLVPGDGAVALLRLRRGARRRRC